MSADIEASVATPAPPLCARCVAAAPEPGHAAPLCAPCRDILAKRPFPIWIRLAAVLIVALVAVALVDLPRSLQLGIAFEHGQRAEQSGNYAVAIAEYKKVYEAFPDSDMVAARLLIACCYGGRPAEAADAMRILKRSSARHKLSKGLTDEINRALDRQDYFH